MRYFTFVFMLITIYSCKNEQINEINKSANYQISGTVNEIDEFGQRPSQNAKIYVIQMNEDTVDIKTTDFTGNFNFQFKKETVGYGYNVNLLVSKEGFKSLTKSFILFEDLNESHLQLISNKEFLYFPIKVGNTWKYERNDYSGDYNALKIQGKEIWEITKVDSSGINFSMDIYFTGTQIYLVGGIEKLRTSFDMQKKSYDMHFENGQIVSSDDKINYYFKKIQFKTTFSPGFIYEYDSGESNSYQLKYKLSTQKGIENYYRYYYDGSWHEEFNLKLLDFNEVF